VKKNDDFPSLDDCIDEDTLGDVRKYVSEMPESETLEELIQWQLEHQAVLGFLWAVADKLAAMAIEAKREE
jgi:hypothetical protein